MRKIYLLLFIGFFFLLNSTSSIAQLSGPKSIPGDYASLALAVTDLNAQGVGAGGVIFSIATGYTENITAPILITATGTVANTITFQKNGAGANPLITRTDAGSNTTSTLGGQGDAVILIEGSDYIIFDGIDVAASAQGIEYGYYLRKADATNGCKNITIKNAGITMTKGTSPYVVGIYSSNNVPASTVSSATGITVTSTGGRNENNSFTGNTISNVFAGIILRGYNHGTPYDFYDQNNTVGATGAGNTINNYGGNTASTSYGVYMIYQNNVNASYNNIDNTAGGGSNFTTTGYGIFHTTATNGNGTYNNNTITLASNTGQLRGITFGTTGTADHIANNNTITLSQAGTSEVAGIYLNAAVNSATINNNTFSIGTFASTTTSYLIYASSATNNVTVNGNQITGPVNKTGNGTFYCYYNLGSPTGGTETITNNNFSGITIAGGSSTTGGIYSNTAVAQNRVCHSNTISNWTVASTGTTAPLYLLSANNNQVYNNQANNITVSAAGTLYGLYFSGNNATVYGNTIHTLSNGGTTFYGLWAAGTITTNCYSNKIYGLSNTNNASTAANILTGIYTSAGATNNIYNNLVGELTAPSSVSPEAIRGIYVNYTTASTNANIYYNSVYINASSTGSNFGTTGVFHTTSATSTSGSLTLRNNIIVNKSTAAGTGVVVAYRRSSATTANYNPASDNNLFYAGVPSPTNLIYTDGTNSFEDLASYKTFMLTVGADQNSVTEDIPFQSTSGASPNFLKYNTAVVTQAESKAENITGITTDFAGTIRQGNPGYTGTGLKPDIGAWELEGILPSCSGTPAPSNTIASLNPACAGQPFLLSLSVTYTGVTYQWQSSLDNIIYNDIPGATNPTQLENGPAVATWYRAIISCNTNTQTSTPVQVTVSSPLTGIYTINNLNPTAGSNFNNFDDAIETLNCRGVSGPVTFNVTAGQVFPGSSPLEITATGTSVNTITFQKSGVGANPKIQRSGTAGATDFVLKISGGDYITFNGIDFEQTGTAAADWVEFGIHIVNISPTDGAWNNVFKNGVVSVTPLLAAAKGIYVQSAITPTAASGTNSNNRFLNMTVQNSHEGYRIAGISNTFTDDGNEINTESAGTSLVQNLGDGSIAASMYGIIATFQTHFKVKNTEINNLQVGGTSLVYGIALQSASNNSAEFSNNHIHNLTGSGTVNGINVTSADTADIFNNHIHALTTNTATSSAIRGMDLSATGANINIYSNRIYDVSSAGLTTTTAVGIEVATGLEYNIYNNMVSDIRAGASTTTTGGTRGISVSGGSTGSIVRLYYNTVVLNDVGTVAGYTSAALHNSSTTPDLDIRNNIFINKSNITTGTRAVAFWKTSTTINQLASTDFNLYYAGTPAANRLLYYDATNSAQTIVQLQAISGMAPRELNSVTEDVQFSPVTNGLYRPLPSVATVAESGGQVIPGYAVDFENHVRPGPPGSVNGGGLRPDLGADEFDGIPLDRVSPFIAYTNLLVTCETGNRILTGVVITDVGGVPVAGAFQPRIYYRKNAGAWFSSQGTLTSGTGTDGTWSFTIVAADMGGLAAGDAVQYYVIAQDLSGNIKANPSAGLVAIDVNTVAVAPTTPNSYQIGPSLVGTYTVGAGGNYTTLTAAIAAYNTACLTGAVVFELTQASYSAGETFPITINQNLYASAVNTLTIRPATGIAAVISGSSSTGALVDLNGARYVNFNGVNNAGSSLLVRNTSTTIPVFRFINDATNNSITNTTIEGSVTSTTNGQILFSTSTGTTGNSNNTISNNIIRDRTDALTAFGVGIYSSGTAAATNASNTISGNNIFNFTGTGVSLSSTGLGTNWTITANHFYNNLATAPTTAQNGILIAGGTGHTVSNNFIGGNAPNASGVWTNSGNVVVNGISITGGVTAVTGNTIANITNTNTGTTTRTRGISITSSVAGVTVNDNIIFNLSSFGAVTGNAAGSQAVLGIYARPGTPFVTAVVARNRIYNIVAENTTALTTSNIAAGVFLTDWAGDFYSNIIYDIKNKSTGTTAGQPPIAAGLYARFISPGNLYNNMISLGFGESNNVQYAGVLVIGAGSTGNDQNYYHNSIRIGGTATGSFSSYAFLRGENTTTTSTHPILFNNNILSMERTGAGSVNYAIGNQGTTASTAWVSNYNDLYSSDPAAIGYWNATGYTLAGWQAASAGDANSISVLPSFVSNIDLHLVTPGNAGLDNLGTPIALVTTDIDLQPRSATTPDMGADEFSSAAPGCTGAVGGTAIASPAGPFCGTATTTLSATGFSTGAGSTYIWQSSVDAAFTTPLDIGVPNVVYADHPTGSLTTTTYYRLKVTCTSGTAIAYSNVVTVTVTPTPAATISYAGSPYCSNAGTATVIFTGTTGGVFSSTAGLVLNASTGAVDLAASTAGTYTVTYSIAASGGCSLFTTTTTITIDIASAATISYTGSPYCSGAGLATPTLTGTTGGTFSSTAGLVINASSGVVDLAASTVGTYTVTYTIAAVGSCPAVQATASITIATSPAATISYLGSPYCSNSGTVTVNRIGSAGGVYSSTTGLSLNTSTGEVNTNTSTPGTYTVTYTIAAAGGCSAFSTTTSITINAAPSATIMYAGSPYCSSGGAALVTHTGTTGGVYTASPVGLTIDPATGTVTPSTSIAGTYLVTYTVAASGGCGVYTVNAPIVISPAPSATISYAGSPYCTSGGTATVTHTGVVGGVYSSSPAGLTIDPATGTVTLGTSTAGTYTVTYTIPSSGGCAVFTTTASITVLATPGATISYASSPYCSNGGTATVTQTGTAGGVYSASPAGLSINTASGAINLGSSTPGTYTVTYTLPASGSCPAFSTTASITINVAPAASISYSGSPYCGTTGTAPVIRTGTAGGVYSASPAGLSINASTGEVNLGTSAAGTYTVTYTIAAAGGCAVFTTTTSIVINAPASATIAYTSSPYCINGGTATVTHTGTTGGTYSATPAGLTINSATGAVTLGTSTAGTYTVTYTVAAANGCPAFTTTAQLVVSTAVSATISYAGSPFCSATGTANVTFSGTTGGVYTASPAGLSINATTGEINLATSTAGNYTVTYTLTATGGCAAFSTNASVVLSAAGTWLGITSSDWNTSSNWCGGVPTATTDVVIPTVAPNMPILSGGTGSARNITINTGASVVVGAGGVLNLYGNISGAGTFNPVAGSIVFSGTTNQLTPGFTATNVTMNGAGGWTPSGNVVVTGTLTLTNGNITLGTNNISLHNSSTGSTASHIIINSSGRVIAVDVAASQSRVIPIGIDAASYNPVWLVSNTGHTTDNFTIGVVEGVFVNGVSGAQFDTHVVDRMWLINEGTPGGSNVNLTLQWNGAEELTGFDRTRAYIMQYVGTGWVPGLENAAFGTNPYSLTRLNVTSFGAFAVQKQPIPRPLTGIYPNPTKGTLNVVVDLPAAQKVWFTVFDAAGKKVHEANANLNAGLNLYTMDMAYLSGGLYFIKVSILSNPEYMLTKFIRE